MERVTSLKHGLKFAIAAAVMVGPTAAAAVPMTLAPHRAVYDISLIDSEDDVDITAVSGRLVMEFTGSACTGYSSKLRFVTQTEDPDGVSRLTDARSTTFESPDGLNLDFANETYAGPILAEESKGTASRGKDGISVKLSKPQSKALAISGPMVFPTDQMEKILASARKGESFLTMEVYDGSEDGETVFETAGVIGRVSTAADDIGDETVVADAGIARLRHWPLTLSYFDKSDTGDDTPFYVLSFVIYENGVGRTMKIDYGDFALAGKLTGLELLPSTPCP
ncbi:MAG: cell envelope integrity EipB family protein [Bauldia sp.]|nr:cell envelope integrity EipB family protein [Bauldia sp.]